jgi:hypothetical protein
MSTVCVCIQVVFSPTASLLAFLYSEQKSKTLNSTMDLPVELVGLLKHAGIDGKILTWDLQVNSNAVSVKLVWIKAVILRRVNVGCLCLYTSCILTNGFPFSLPLVYAFGVSSPGGRYRCLLIIVLFNYPNHSDLDLTSGYIFTVIVGFLFSWALNI